MTSARLVEFGMVMVWLFVLYILAEIRKDLRRRHERTRTFRIAWWVVFFAGLAVIGIYLGWMVG
jgi:heme A synthase